MAALAFGQAALIITGGGLAPGGAFSHLGLEIPTPLYNIGIRIILSVLRYENIDLRELKTTVEADSRLRQGRRWTQVFAGLGFPEPPSKLSGEGIFTAEQLFIVLKTLTSNWIILCPPAWAGANSERFSALGGEAP